MFENKTPVPLESPAFNDIPQGVKGWSWGAFLLTPFWAIGNRTWIGVLAFIPYVSFSTSDRYRGDGVCGQ